MSARGYRPRSGRPAGFAALVALALVAPWAGAASAAGNGMAAIVQVGYEDDADDFSAARIRAGALAVAQADADH